MTTIAGRDGITRVPAGPLDRIPSPSIEDAPASATAGSIAGAESIQPRAKALGQRVLDLLAQAGAAGLTNGELSNITGLRDMTLWPRVSVLKKRGKLRDSRRTRPSPITGVRMTVWVLTTKDEETAILERNKRDEIVEPPGKEAHAAATEILEGFAVGGLFAGRDHIERTIQAALNARLSTMARAETRRREKEAARNG